MSYGNDCDVNNEWRHSTQVDVQIPDFDVYAKTRTFIRQQTVSLIQHGYYEDETLTDSTVSSTFSSSSSSSSDCSCQMYFPASTTQISSSSSTTASSSYFERPSIDEGIIEDADDSNPIVYVCTYEFTSKIDGDLNLVIGERVRLIHKGKSNDYLLVKSMFTGKCGYVPRFCLTPLSQL